MPDTKVFFGRLPRDYRLKDLERLLDGHGYNFKNVNLKTGYAFVEFASSREADDAIRNLHRKDVFGERIAVELAKSETSRDDRRTTRRNDRQYDDKDESYRDRRDDRRDDRRRDMSPYNRPTERSNFRNKYGAPYNTEWRINVKNISSRVGWQDLKDLFRKYGTVTYSECHKKVKGEGLIDFETESDMKKAYKKIQNYDLHGKKLKLSCKSISNAESGKRNASTSSEASENSGSKRGLSKSSGSTSPKGKKNRSLSNSPKNITENKHDASINNE